GAVSIAQSIVYNLVYNMNAGLPWESLFISNWLPDRMSRRLNEEPTASNVNVNRILRARITGLTPMGAGTAGITEGRDLYRLEYRLLPEDQENIILCSGMQTEVIDGETWITEWTESGQPYLLIGWEEPEGGPGGNPAEEPLWTLLGSTNTRQVEEVYGTPEMREKYGSVWLAASMEIPAAGKTEEPVRAISLRYSDVTLRPGESFRQTATISSALEGETVTWQTEDSHVATVSPEGHVTAVDHGTTRIIASAGGVTASCIVRVHGAAQEPVQSESDVFTEGQLRWVEESETPVSMPIGKLTLREGDSYPQIAEISSTLRGETITWVSEDPAVAAVSDKGVITGVNLGTTKVRITVGEHSAECMVQVKKYPPDPAAGEDSGITLSYSYLILLTGQRCVLNAALSPALAGEELTWSSSDPAVAAVSPEGVITAVAPGNAVILASAGDGETDCAVSVIGGDRMATEEDGYPVNERGETYGPIRVEDDCLTTICPDLEQACGRTPEGEEILGYIRVFDEYNGGPLPHPRDPGEAIAYTAVMDELRRQALDEGRDYLYSLPLYDKDGVTVIGFFPVGNV
ncbi:MAG: Ig-like domain-containing protein, partial [Oscillospiraceae bacterium]|nr:Ig-like domain-containing protein [Oscillospiraceae bacterium]